MTQVTAETLQWKLRAEERQARIVHLEELMGVRAGWDAAMEHFPTWMPVSEGLPKEDEKVLAFFLPDIDEAYELKICSYDDDCRVWRETATDDRQDYIIAWMPLPKAYKP